MNKQILLAVLLGFGITCCFAQSNTFPGAGSVGIGTNTPQSQVHILSGTSTGSHPSTTSRGDITLLMEASNNALEFGNSRAMNSRRAWILARHSDITGVYSKHYSDLHLQPNFGDKSYYRGVSIGYSTNQSVSYGTHLAVNGRVGIGTTNPTEMLTVNGTVRAKEVKVDNINWPDYVFTEEYQQKTLPEVEDFIKINGHLPGIPSAKEVAENGISLSAMNARLLEKIEELTLHVIEQNKQISDQHARLRAIEEGQGNGRKRQTTRK